MNIPPSEALGAAGVLTAGVTEVALDGVVTSGETSTVTTALMKNTITAISTELSATILLGTSWLVGSQTCI